MEKILVDVVKYVEDNIDKKITIEEMSEEVHISSVHLQRLFRHVFHMPIAEYVRSRKLHRALRLLYETDKKICDIAYDVGFEYESSFIRSFKREFGMTPSDVRKYKRKLRIEPPLDVNKFDWKES